MQFPLFRLRPVFVVCFLATILGPAASECLYAAESSQTASKNIALGKPYTFSREANYAATNDPDDSIQLTDGQKTKGHFWGHKSTVGWQGEQPVLITIDLGQVEPIRGVSLSMAAGRAEVEWPDVLMILISDDGQQWHLAGNLQALSSKPPEKGYAKHIYQTSQLETYGRYVMFGALTAWRNVFIDELEVFGGSQKLLESDRGTALDDIEALMFQAKVTKHIGCQLHADLKNVRSSIQSAATPQSSKTKWREAAKQLSQRVHQLPIVERPGFKAILPMNDLQRDIFSLQAQVWRAQGKPFMRLWKTHRWEMLGPSDEPPTEADPVKLHVDLLNGEHRADVLNITSAADEDLQVQVRVEGLPGGTNPDYVSLHEVLCIGNRHLGAISSPLPFMERQGDEPVLTIASGMTRQIWFDFHPTDLPPGRHQGRIVLETRAGEQQSVPVELVVWPGNFPKQTSLLLSGFTYTNGHDERSITDKNRDAVIAFLREYHVNVPWGTQEALPEGRYDTEGNLIEPPNTANFDAWVKRWPDAERFMVFLEVGGGYHGVDRDNFAGSAPGTKLFEKKIAAWAHFWVDHMRSLSLRPDQLGINIFDEPMKKNQYDLVATWAKAIKQAEPELVIWVDLNPKTEDGTYLPMMAEVDELLPYRLLWQKHIDWYPALFEKQRNEGRAVGFYSCHQPARSFDPYSYYLLQSWHSFQIGGTWSAFWSFSDVRGFDPWNNYATNFPGSYCPIILSETGAITDKRMEAVRESAQDFEYLVMLRDRVEALETTDAKNPSLPKARRVLDTACDKVLAEFEGTNFRWDKQLDRTIVDKVRVDLLKARSVLIDK